MKSKARVVNWAVEAHEGEQHVVDGLLVNSAEYVGKQLKTDKSVPGRLRNDEYADFYRDVLKADQETVAIIRYGYNIPLDSMPPETGITPNNKSCEAAPDFVREEMVRYTALGCIREVDRPSRVMLPLSWSLVIKRVLWLMRAAI